MVRLKKIEFENTLVIFFYIMFQELRDVGFKILRIIASQVLSPPREVFSFRSIFDQIFMLEIVKPIFWNISLPNCAIKIG